MKTMSLPNKMANGIGIWMTQAPTKAQRGAIYMSPDEYVNEKMKFIDNNNRHKEEKHENRRSLHHHEFNQRKPQPHFANHIASLPHSLDNNAHHRPMHIEKKETPHSSQYHTKVYSFKSSVGSQERLKQKIAEKQQQHVFRVNWSSLE